MRLVRRRISFFRQGISQPSSNIMMTPAHWRVRKGPPSYLVSHGRCGFQRTARKECQETSGGRGGTEASRTASQVVGQQRGLRTTAEQPKADDPSRIESPRTWIGTTELNRRDQVTAPNSWPSSRPEIGAKVDYQVAAPTVSRTPTLQRATNAHQRLRMEGWRQRRLGE